MKINSFILGLLFASTTFVNAQNIENKVLFTIENKPFYTDEFVRVYNKNLDLVKDESQKDIDNYLDLFLGYKLKVEKAYKENLNKGEGYINELKTHRDQLAKNYLNDSEVTQQLLDEAYQRYKLEVKASHILLALDEKASDADAKKVYEKALQIRNRALKGEDFGKLAAEFSSDPSAKDNKGDLGYFSVFKMVYPFESAAYTTKVGEVSMPVRTQFGYHIIKTTNVRENRGEVTVKHIMITPKDGNDLEAEKKVNEIYTKILAGESFEDLAKNHSNDTSSASRGGLMATFRSGDIAFEEFENESFALKSEGDVSKPFKTKIGWHIVKLVNKKPIEAFEDVKNYLEGRIARDSRSQKIQIALSDKAKKQYTYVTDTKNLEALIKLIDVNKFGPDWKLDENNALNNKNILVINKVKAINVNDFVKFLTLQANYTSNYKPISKFVKDTYAKFLDQNMVSYYDENLENRNTEFKYIVDEYRDGLLIFELLEKDIWNKAKSDTLALQNIYNLNKDKYTVAKRYNADVFSLTDKKIAKQVLKQVRKNVSIEDIKTKFNTTKQIQVMVRSEVFNETDNALPKPLNDSKKVNGIISKDNYHYIVKINEVLPASQLSFEEAKSRIISDYQQELEANWVKNLKEEFKVNLNQNVFNDLKKALNKN